MTAQPIVLSPGQSVTVAAAPLPPPPPVPQPSDVLDARTYVKPTDLPQLMPGAWWRFRPGALITFPWFIAQPCRIEGAVSRLPRQAKIGADLTSIVLGADGITLDAMCEGGQQHVKWTAKSGLQIRLVSRFRAGAAIAATGAGDDIDLSGDIGPSLYVGPSVITVRGSESDDPAKGVVTHLVVHDLVTPALSGSGMGVELKQCPGWWIDRLRGSGGSAIASVPNGDGGRLTRSFLDLRGMRALRSDGTPWPYGDLGWGIELSRAKGVTIGGAPDMGNVFIGDDDGTIAQGAGHAAISCNNGADRAEVSWNRFEGLRAVFNPGWVVPPSYHDNILVAVQADVNPTYADAKYPAPVAARNGAR